MSPRPTSEDVDPAVTTAPYGSWVSPITAADYAAGSHPVAGGTFVGDDVWWLELRPAEGGRYAVRRAGADGSPEDLLPAPWNARTRVHEYGGGAWTTAAGALVFAEFSDQRLYRLAPGAQPTPLTPEPAVPGGARYAELQVVGDEVWCVRETHDAHGGIVRDLAAVPLDGSAVSDPAAVRSVVGGSHFLAGARVSPDGSRLAWIAWEHPQMPWDGTELRVADLVDGVARDARTLLGSTTESVLQPEWADDGAVYVISDRSGFWNLYRVGVDSGAVEPLHPVEADLGGSLWMLGMRWYAPLDDGRLLTVRSFGVDTLAVLDPASGELTDIDLPGHSSVSLGGRRGDQVLLSTGGARVSSGLRRLDLTASPHTGAQLTDVRLGADDLPDVRYFPDAQLMTFTGPQGRDVHTIVYPPHNPDFAAPAGEHPPFVAFVHGGPTGRVVPAMSVLTAYFTSRGIGVVDVNYGGSTGYGREYRNRLRGQWGVVDVEDTVAAVLGLADAGIADRDRLAIEGGSAGGWTVLSALTTSDVFACGTSFFGVAELVRFVSDTHDFESRYLDGLVGPLPEARELYDTRAPLNNVAGLSCPVLLLQGLDDPIVPPSQAELFRDALVAKGIPHAYRAYEGESHGFRKRETIIDSREAELSFYGQILGFDPPGIPRLELWRP
ncbi:prolyl oligopeptidase family serine peptidase [uncultured Jatrophihabitans sp.]|uniref:dipeptidyl-peptidase 5 n=1 Tax=uncultured Jatrophihabitans sp. TaxID=1610747 RepID=UPI0035C9A13F